jgi:hypothetical protein
MAEATKVTCAGLSSLLALLQGANVESEVKEQATTFQTAVDQPLHACSTPYSV